MKFNPIISLGAQTTSSLPSIRVVGQIFQDSGRRPNRIPPPPRLIRMNPDVVDVVVVDGHHRAQVRHYEHPFTHARDWALDRE